MRTADFNYVLPAELIAQCPAPNRDQSRLMVFERPTGRIAHRRFADLREYLRPGDVLVLNDSRVIPARLRGRNARNGGNFEMLLLEEKGPNTWWAMIRPGKRAQPGTRIEVLGPEKKPSTITAVVEAINAEGHRRLRFEGTENIRRELEALGEMPLPPYIERTQPRPEDRQRYQTVYAQVAGSVAAPTAGLHFTEDLLRRIRGQGVDVRSLTLHIGPGTFAPVKAERIHEHVMHEERFDIGAETARAVNNAKATPGQRIIAVGTTTVRVLETVARAHQGKIVPGSGQTDIFISPSYQFKVVDTLITNFHLPCSTLLMLVSAFATPGETNGRELMLRTYEEAVRQRYRFFSYGDAMLIL
jgi:S-adenosylmethionine:tRNA ribosyltransferase-isomerase